MSLFSALSVSASGMAAQRVRAEVTVENLANADTTRTPGGGPYRRKDVVFETLQADSSFASLLSQQLVPQSTGVGVSEILVDNSEPELKYMPGHPDANKDGYVGMPRVNAAEDMVDLLSASRGFQANVAATSAIKDMIYRSIEILK